MTCESQPYLSAAIGIQEKYVEDKVKEWFSEVLLLAKIAESQLHVTYSAFTH